MRYLKGKRKVIVDLWGFRMKISVTKNQDKFMLYDGRPGVQLLGSGKLTKYHERCFGVPLLNLKRRDKIFPGQKDWEDFYAIFWSKDGKKYFIKKLIHVPGWQLPNANDRY